MEDSVSTALEQFCARYAMGGGSAAVAPLLPFLDQGADGGSHRLLDYCHALCFADLIGLLYANGRLDSPILREALLADQKLLCLLGLPKEELPPAWFLEPWLAQCADNIKGGDVCLEALAESCPSCIRERLCEHLRLRQLWRAYLTAHPELSDHVDPDWVCFVPTLAPPPPPPTGVVEFIDQPSLQHCLFYHDLSGRTIHVLDRYPHHLPDAAKRFHAARERSFAEQAERLGARCHIAFHMDATHRRWRCPHKEGALPSPSFPLPPRNILARSFSSGKLKLAHVVGQLVDANHAPSRVCRTLFAHHSRDLFELSCLVSELYVPRSEEYPLSCCLSATTRIRAPRTLEALRGQGTRVWIEERFDRYEATKERLIAQLRSVDIAVFHGPGPVHLLAAAGCDAPAIVFFEHGELPPKGLFDLVIASDARSAEEMDCLVLPFAIDHRLEWEEAVYPSSAWCLPENARILTTSSLNLGNRLSTSMLETVRCVLERIPDGYYAPLGPISPADEQRCRAVLGSVNDRVHFLGEKSNTAQWVRSAALYLNEFPFGGCLSVLEALAAGVPVIALNDPFGPAQGRYGAQFYGRHAASPELYARLACELLTDANKHHSWSKEALLAYERIGSAPSYVANIEAALCKLARLENGKALFSPS